MPPDDRASMLLRFSVSNYRSIKDEQELSLIATSLRDSEAGLMPIATADKIRALPLGIIYGANASGKTTLLAALRFMRSSILESHSKSHPGSGIPRQAFKLDDQSRSLPSKMEIDFVVHGVRFNYGFLANDASFVEEWLFSYPNNRRQLLFSRDNGKYDFGRSMRGQNRVISELTRDDSLFFSTAIQNDHKQIVDISSFFRKMEILTDRNHTSSHHLLGDQHNKVDRRVIKFLQRVGTGISGYRVKKIEISDRGKRLQESFQKIVHEYLNDKINFDLGDEILELQLARKDENGATVYFDLQEESSGTISLLEILSRIFRAIDNGSFVAVDELDNSLHTLACEAVIELFSSGGASKKGAQLLLTTHDTNLLCSNRIRRDEVWFVEKDQLGASHLYPLSDIRVRAEDNWERGYLQGRFGAVPFAGAPALLFGDI